MMELLSTIVFLRMDRWIVQLAPMDTLGPMIESWI